jgi:hypothetical protein
MKKNLMLLFAMVAILLSSTTFTFAQNLKKLDEKNGFRDAIFESDTSAYKDLVFLEGDGNTKYYKRTSDELKIGDSELDGIIYGFYKGKLSTVMLTTKGYTNSRGVLSVLNAQYGRGYQSNQFMEKYSWSSKNVLMSYTQNSITDDATIFMFSRIIMAQESKDKKSAASNAADDL